VLSAKLKTVGVKRPVRGLTLTLQRKTGKAWTKIGKAVTDSHGKAHASVTVKSTSTFRWVFGGHGLLLGSSGPARTVRG
jgi:5-hydroxyisourate hydrolase-like protein (transthyretin family)